MVVVSIKVTFDCYCTRDRDRANFYEHVKTTSKVYSTILPSNFSFFYDYERVSGGWLHGYSSCFVPLKSTIILVDREQVFFLLHFRDSHCFVSLSLSLSVDFFYFLFPLCINRCCITFFSQIKLCLNDINEN